MKRSRRSEAWRELEAQLECVGVALQTPSLVLEPQPAEGLRYAIPMALELLVEADGVEWLEWTLPGPFDPVLPLCPARGACLPSFMRLGDAPLREVLDCARAWGPLGEGWRRALPGSFPPYPELRDILRQRRINADEYYRWEPVDAWRQLARQLAATLRLAARLQRGELPALRGSGSEGWEAIMAADPQGVLPMAWRRELYARRPVAVVGPQPSREDLVRMERGQALAATNGGASGGWRTVEGARLPR